MCTVTYIPIRGGFCLTSNRDESVSRETIPPQFYKNFLGSVVYPKDVQAGGTWIATSDRGLTACLLNGAFEKHERILPYRLSRGKILLNFFNALTISSFLEEVNLEKIEPFTLLMLDHSSKIMSLLYELRWDGKKKHVKKLSPETPHIWSSSTIYSKETREHRKKLFENWLKAYQNFEDKMIYHFHTRHHDLPNSEGIIINRGENLRTVSVSQIRINSDSGTFSYEDLMRKLSYNLDLVDRTHYV